MNTNGIGLGLFVCKSIVEQFGGTIEVNSTLGKGTTFYFWFALETAAVSKQSLMQITKEIEETKAEECSD